jgi:hypothetical protein
MTDHSAARARRIGGRTAALAVSALIAAAGVLPAGAVHAAPSTAKTSTLIVKVLKGHHRVSGMRLCPYDAHNTTKRAGRCGKTNQHGIARLHRVKVGRVDLVAVKKAAMTLEATNVKIKRRNVNHYTVQINSQSCTICS